MTKVLDMDLKTAIRDEIIRQQSTQVELAERAQMQQSEISRALSDERDPRLSTVEKIIAALGCEVRLVPIRRA